MSPDSFLPLKPKTFHVLLALSRQPQHGYGLKKAIEARTHGAINLDPGGLYRLVGRLEDEGLVEPVPAPEGAESDDPRRRYFALTDLGAAVLKADARRLSDLAAWSDVKALAQADPT